MRRAAMYAVPSFKLSTACTISNGYIRPRSNSSRRIFSSFVEGSRGGGIEVLYCRLPNHIATSITVAYWLSTLSRANFLPKHGRGLATTTQQRVGDTHPPAAKRAL